MKVRLFSKDSNPLCDRPLLHNSSAYVDGLILSGEARYLEDSDPAAWISDPASCDNDRWIAVNWMVHGEGSSNGIWRAKPDGSDAAPLKSKTLGSLWGCSQDGKWLYYSEQSTNGVF